jgi:hypothetical protein
MLPPPEIDTMLFPRFPALPGENGATTGLELSLARRSSEAPTPTHGTNECDAVTASDLSREALEAALQLSRIRSKILMLRALRFLLPCFLGLPLARLRARRGLLLGHLFVLPRPGHSARLRCTRQLFPPAPAPPSRLLRLLLPLLAWGFLWLGRLPLLSPGLLLHSNITERSVVGLLKTQQS